MHTFLKNLFSLFLITFKHTLEPINRFIWRQNSHLTSRRKYPAIEITAEVNLRLNNEMPPVRYFSMNIFAEPVDYTVHKYILTEEAHTALLPPSIENSRAKYSDTLKSLGVGTDCSPVTSSLSIRSTRNFAINPLKS